MLPFEQTAELVNLYHLARTALCGRDASRYARKCWAAAEFHRAHPEISASRAYKALDRALA